MPVSSYSSLATDPKIRSFAFLAFVTLSWLTPVLCVAAHAADVTVRRSVNEGIYVPIGGIEQWISIKGEDVSNPVVLVLHGGPGDAWSPFADAMFAGWEKNFTMVQWDQRGAGRTFGKHGGAIASSLTIERMVADGIEVSEFLRKHFKQKKVIVVGGSWGSVLGAHLAHQRPDLIHAYLGFAQVVNMQTAIATCYNNLLSMARGANDQAAISALEGIGTPPWNTVRKWPVFRKLQRTYQAKLVTAPSAPYALSPEYASPAEQAQYEQAEEFSFENFWGMTLAGPLMSVDLARLGKTFRVPMFMFQGTVDLTAPPDLAKTYFDSIDAPRKYFYLVPGTGHEPSAPLLDLMHKVLLEDVRPTVIEQ